MIFNTITKNFKEWWKWQRSIDWELINIQCGTWQPGTQVSILNPYFIETWKNKRTGEIRFYECT